MAVADMAARSWRMFCATRGTTRLGLMNRSLSTTASINGLASFVRKTLFGSEEEKSYYIIIVYFIL